MNLVTHVHLVTSSRMSKLRLRSSIKLNGEVLEAEYYRWMGSIHTSCYVGPGFRPCFGKELYHGLCCVAVYPCRCRDIIYNSITADSLIPLSRPIKTAIRRHRYMLQAADKIVKIRKQIKTITLRAQFEETTLEDHCTANDLLWSKLHDESLEASRPAAV